MNTIEKIKNLRMSYGYSIAKLSQLVGTSASNLSRIESGKVKLSTSIATKLASVFHVSLDYLLGSSVSNSIDKFLDATKSINHYENEPGLDSIEQTRILCMQIVARLPRELIEWAHYALTVLEAKDTFKDCIVNDSKAIKEKK